ncbi:MAG TPA: hypothetical protein PLI34_18070 [Saprospiraceae bacterium]|nr:hypothetical protein [Saprospiraceae bacterium]HRK82300.1 hypothetical protein [Saprospiraceae bacterium]
MKITTNADEVLISIPKGILEMRDIQDFIDYVRYKVIISKSKATDADIAALTEEINEALGASNKLFTEQKK